MAENSLRDRKRDIIQAIYGSGFGPFVVVPSNTLPLHDGVENVVVRSVFVGVAGHITGKVATVTWSAGIPTYGESDTIKFSNVPVGLFEMAFTEIHATGTTATNMVAVK